MLFNVTEARIKAFEEMMGKYLPAAFIDWLKENGFFTADMIASQIMGGVVV